MDAQVTKENRLELLKQSADQLKQKKKDGLDLGRSFSLGEVVFSKDQERFGRVMQLDDDKVVIDFGNDRLHFKRRKDGPKSAEADADAGDRIKWDDEKDAFLRDNLNRSNQWLAEELGTSVASIKGRTHRLKATGFIDTKQRRNFIWKPEDDQFLIANIQESNSWLAEKLDTSVGSVKGRIRRLRDQGVLPRSSRRNK